MLRSVAEKWFNINSKVSDCYRWMAITAVAVKNSPLNMNQFFILTEQQNSNHEDEKHPIHAFLSRN